MFTGKYYFANCNQVIPYRGLLVMLGLACLYGHRLQIITRKIHKQRCHEIFILNAEHMPISYAG